MLVEVLYRHLESAVERDAGSGARLQVSIVGEAEMPA